MSLSIIEQKRNRVDDIIVNNNVQRLLNEKNLVHTAYNQYYPKLIIPEICYCSNEGMQQLLKAWDPNNPNKNNIWATDVHIELPIRVKQSGAASIQPRTLIDVFQETVKRNPSAPSLSTKGQNGVWKTVTFQQEYDQCIIFAKSLMALKIPIGKSINIIGFNSTEWFISFFGSMFARVLPCGVYTTTQQDQCCYICNHSECKIIVVENQCQLKKYLNSWDQQLLPELQYAIIYNDKKPTDLPEKLQNRVFLWEEFLDIGRNQYNPKHQDEYLETRIRQIKPGHCCSLVYTSGTTGPPKGAMLSHDNYFWEGAQLPKYLTLSNKGVIRELSYLPLSHIAAQLFDLIANIQLGAHIYFADQSALQNNLIQFLREVRPTWFFAVPRVWEKLETSIIHSGLIKGQEAQWAMSIGVEGTEAEEHQKKLPDKWRLAKEKIFNSVKDYIGLDQSMSFSFSAAPMQVKTRLFFLQLNMNLLQCYGMTEMAGPQFYQTAQHSQIFDQKYLRSTGRGQDGTDVKLKNIDQEGKGNICYRGRNRFMGYFKDDLKTAEAIDSDGYIDSGDIGQMDEFGNLEITGRAKELIITSGGENVPPVLIEDIVKQELKCVNNCMLIGDNRKYLSLLICLRQEIGKAGKLKKLLAKDVYEEFKLIGSAAKTIQEAKKCSIVLQYIQNGINRANQKAASKAQYIQKWVILDKDFSVEGGELTSTMKLQRKVTEKKYKEIIDSIYQEAKL